MEWRTFFKQNVLNGAKDYIRSNSVQDLTIAVVRTQKREVTASIWPPLCWHGIIV